MREILFRGKSGAKWAYGDLYHLNDGRVTIRKDGELYPYEVIPETVGQYTGLEDKNGKSIFDGDIVAGSLTWLGRKKNGLVAFKDGSFGLIWYRGDIEQFNAFTSMCNVEYEIIGNIYDNPDLLKGE